MTKHSNLWAYGAHSYSNHHHVVFNVYTHICNIEVYIFIILAMHTHNQHKELDSWNSLPRHLQARIQQKPSRLRIYLNPLSPPGSPCLRHAQSLLFFIQLSSPLTLSALFHTHAVCLLWSVCHSVFPGGHQKELIKRICDLTFLWWAQLKGSWEMQPPLLGQNRKKNFVKIFTYFQLTAARGWEKKVWHRMHSSLDSYAVA